MPPQAPIEGEREMAAKKEGDALHEARLDREEHLPAKLQERRQSPLQAWEGVLYRSVIPIQIYPNRRKSISTDLLLTSCFTETSFTWVLRPKPGLSSPQALHSAELAVDIVQKEPDLLAPSCRPTPSMQIAMLPEQ